MCAYDNLSRSLFACEYFNISWHVKHAFKKWSDDNGLCDLHCVVCPQFNTGPTNHTSFCSLIFKELLHFGKQELLSSAKFFSRVIYNQLKPEEIEYIYLLLFSKSANLQKIVLLSLTPLLPLQLSRLTFPHLCLYSSCFLSFCTLFHSKFFLFFFPPLPLSCFSDVFTAFSSIFPHF